MSLKNEIESGLKVAIREQDVVAKRSLRMVLTNIKLAEVQKGEPLSDAEVQAVLQKETKTLRETAQEARQSGRADLAKNAEAEILVLEKYLPRPFSAGELNDLVEETIAELGATSPAEMGQVMKVLMPRVQGRAEGGQVSALVKEKLAGN